MGYSLTVAVNYALHIYCYCNTLSKLLNCLCGNLCTRFPFANIFSVALLCYMGERSANTSCFPHFNIKTCSEMLAAGMAVCGCYNKEWKTNKLSFTFSMLNF
jgi:hypothetical protein